MGMWLALWWGEILFRMHSYTLHQHSQPEPNFQGGVGVTMVLSGPTTGTRWLYFPH
jgi:hypothetical protein